MKISLLTIFLLCSDSTAIDRARRDVEKLASDEFQGRGNEGRALSANWICEEWKRLKIAPFFKDSYEQRILDGDGKELGKNLIALLPGNDEKLKDEFIIISAHYDHLGKRGSVIYHGADDNASGVAALLEASRVLASERAALKRSVLLIAFDLEEKGMVGSYHFTAQAPVKIDKIAAFLTADMVGRSLWNLTQKHLFLMGAEHSPEVFEFVRGLQPGNFTLATVGADLIGSRSDYAPFRDEEVPFLFLSSGVHPDYHRPSDTAEKIDYAKVVKAAEIMVSFAKHFSAAVQRPKYQSHLITSVDELKTVRSVIAVLLENPDKIGVDPKQVETLKIFVAKLDAWIARGSVSNEERQELANQVGLLLLLLGGH